MPKSGRALTAWRLQAIVQRDGTRCWLCDQHVKPAERTVDHAIPKARGGTNHIHNLRLAHGRCNNERGMIVQTPARAARRRLEKLRLPLPVLELTSDMVVCSGEHRIAA